MLGHGAQHLVVRRGVAEAEGGELRLTTPRDFDRAHAEELHDPAQLVGGQGIAEVFADRELDAGVADELQRSAALAAAWVVEEKVGHGK